MHFNIEIARTISLAYNVVCKPICKELDLPQTAFDILMFLGNNPKYKTAGEIVEIRHIKANLVSVNVDKLVREGYLERKTVEGDRRKTELICTEKAMAVISRLWRLSRLPLLPLSRSLSLLKSYCRLSVPSRLSASLAG